MKTLIMLLMFISAFLIISGIHEQRLQTANMRKKVVYRYIPRSALDEQYYGTQASAHFQGMFAEGKSPWLEARTPQEAGKQPLDYDRRLDVYDIGDVYARQGPGVNSDTDSGVNSDTDSDDDDGDDDDDDESPF